MSWLSENVDELIALILTLVFSAISVFLAVNGRIDELAKFVQGWGPVILPIIGFYFGSKTSQKAYNSTS